MKSLPAALGVMGAVFGITAAEPFGFGVRTGAPEGVEGQQVEGLAIGPPVYGAAKVEGASFSLLGNVTDEMTGFQ